MKRELKQDPLVRYRAQDPLIAKPIPMKRELKPRCSAAIDEHMKYHIAKPIPMKRELKRDHHVAIHNHFGCIAKPIPMKRELKRVRRLGHSRSDQSRDCKAHPDEKGIETGFDGGDKALSKDCKAHPDEKGIETVASWAGKNRASIHCKAHPDEKGIETQERGCSIAKFCNIAKPIPMKRELKRLHHRSSTG